MKRANTYRNESRYGRVAPDPKDLNNYRHFTPFTTFDNAVSDDSEEYYRVQKSPELYTDRRPNSLNRSTNIKQRLAMTSGRSEITDALKKTEASTLRKTTTALKHVVPPIAGIIYDERTYKP